MALPNDDDDQEMFRQLQQHRKELIERRQVKKRSTNALSGSSQTIEQANKIALTSSIGGMDFEPVGLKSIVATGRMNSQMVFNGNKSPLPSTNNLKDNLNSPTFKLNRPQPNQPGTSAFRENEDLENVDEGDSALNDGSEDN